MVNSTFSLQDSVINGRLHNEMASKLLGDAALKHKDHTSAMRSRSVSRNNHKCSPYLIMTFGTE